MDANSIPFINDWNEDGMKDLIVGQSGEYGGTDNIRVYLNTGTNPAPVFGTYTAITCAGSPITLRRICPAIYDLDQDGLKDLIIGEYNGYVWFYKNEGTNATPEFNSSEQLRLRSGPVIRDIANPRIHFNDWTGDGDLDMLMGDYGSYDGNVRLYENATDVGIVEKFLIPQRNDYFTLTPNPVINRVFFNYSLAEAGLVRINVYSIDGRYIATPINCFKMNGNQEFTWDLRDNHRQKLPAGVYLVEFETSNTKQLKRIVLSK